MALAVEQVVHVAHQNVCPAHQFLAQVVGTYSVAQGDTALRGCTQPAFAHGLLTRGRESVVETAGQRAGVGMAGLVRVFAGLLFGHQGQHPQVLPCGAVAQALQGPKRCQPRGFLAGEVGDLVDTVIGHRAQQREQRADSLADAGGRLGQQAAG